MSTKAERTADIGFLEKEFQEATGIFLADNNKINVEKVTRLRSELKKNGIQFIVVKNTLAKIAASRVGKNDLVPYFKGTTALVVTKKEGTVPARLIKDFQRENKNLLGLKVACIGESVFSGEDAIRLADIPSREVLLSQLLGCLQAPVGKFAGVLNGILVKFAGTLHALKEKKENEQ